MSDIRTGIRTGQAPNFCPPTEEGITISLMDEAGDELEAEFLGLIIEGGHSYGFFFPIDGNQSALDSGEVVLLEVLDVDDEGQPCEFELVDDEAVANAVYAEFQKATKDLYRFE